MILAQLKEGEPTRAGPRPAPPSERIPLPEPNMSASAPVSGFALCKALFGFVFCLYDFPIPINK
jgi:hypothetical protein